MKIELYDMGRCTHKPVKGMYKFIVDHAHKFVADQDYAAHLSQQAANRELPGYSIAQDEFSEMCRIWVAAYHSGDFPMNIPALTHADTVRRFNTIKQAGREIGVLTSGSRDFTKLLYSLELGGGRRLSDFVDQYLLGAEIGDKDKADTFSKLWETQEGRIHSIFDDKVSVCEAALDGLGAVGGSSRIYLVDRKGKYEDTTGEIADRVRELEGRGVHRIRTFDDVEKTC